MARLLCATLLLGLISSAFSIRCYECDSSKNVVCNVGLLSFVQNVVDCDEKVKDQVGFLSSFVPKNCIKITAKDINNNEYTARGCGVNVGFKLCDVMAKAVGFMSSHEGVHSIQCSECDTDKCNSAVAVGATALLSVLAACFLFLL